jgi:type III secretion protein R
MTRSAESRSRRLRSRAVALALALVPATAAAAPVPAPGDPAELLGRPIALVVALAIAAVLPFAFMSLTAFIKISTVLQIARGAIGAPNIPSNTVVMALSAALTLIAMAPVGSRIADRAAPLLQPTAPQTTSDLVGGLIEATREPLRAFLTANAMDREKTRFYQIARQAREQADRDRVGKTDLVVVIPAFVVSELVRAFAIGFAIYLPFLVIDLVVSNVLLALGMQMMNPTQVSLPFKLLLFVAVDGWGLLAQALVSGYRPG